MPECPAKSFEFTAVRRQEMIVDRGGPTEGDAKRSRRHPQRIFPPHLEQTKLREELGRRQALPLFSSTSSSSLPLHRTSPSLCHNQLSRSPFFSFPHALTSPWNPDCRAIQLDRLSLACLDTLSHWPEADQCLCGDVESSDEISPVKIFFLFLGSGPPLTLSAGYGFS